MKKSLGQLTQNNGPASDSTLPDRLSLHRGPVERTGAANKAAGAAE